MVDVDIKGFFDHINHEWLLKFLQHRIEDPNIIRLISRFLKSGIMEAGIIYDTPEGAPQGGPASPVLGNIYLHYVLDLWFEKQIRKNCKGLAYMVRYADDSVFCFQKMEDAKEFYAQMIERLKKFNLEIAQEKPRIISWGKEEDDNDSGSFDFLGFTHYVMNGENNTKQIRRKTSKKKYRASLLRCKEWIRSNRHMPTKEFMKLVKSKLQGHCRYYGVTGNKYAVSDFIDEVKRLLFKWLNRRSQCKSFDWDKFNLFLKKYLLPRAKTYINIFNLGAGHSYVT